MARHVPTNEMVNKGGEGLFDGDGFGEVARHVDILSFVDSYIIRKEL